MRINKLLLSICAGAMLISSCTAQEAGSQEEPALKDLLGNDYLVGAAVNQWQVDGTTPYKFETEAVIKHFNCLTAENCMKSEVINPAKGVFNFKLADQFVDFAQKNNMVIIGHSPMWHSQAARWFFFDDKGNIIGKDTLKQRMKDHIFTVMQHYKGKIKGYDVVNEAIEDDGSYRKSLFYKILGEEWVDWAFECAMKADPAAELYYNDFSMDKAGKRKTVVEMIKRLKSKGLRIDAVGMQAHIGMNFPQMSELEASAVAFIEQGVKIQFTEVDISILPNPYEGADVAANFKYSAEKDPYKNGVTPEAQTAWNNRMKDFIAMVNRHKDSVLRVTFWGVSDASSWKNNFPIGGRTDYPLPIDRNGKLKIDAFK